MSFRFSFYVILLGLLGIFIGVQLGLWNSEVTLATKIIASSFATSVIGLVLVALSND